MRLNSHLFFYIFLLVIIGSTNATYINKSDETRFKEAVKNCAYSALNLYGFENLHLSLLNIVGMHTSANYKMEVWGNEYFVKISNHNGNYVQLFYELYSLEETTNIRSELNASSIELVYPLNKHSCLMMNSESRDIPYEEVLIFPFINALTLADIPNKFNKATSLHLTKKAFYMYGQAMALFATTKVNLDDEEYLINIADRHMKNVMFDANNNRLYLIDTVMPEYTSYYHYSAFNLFKEYLNCIYNYLNEQNRGFIDIYGHVIYSAFSDGFHSKLSEIHHSLDIKKFNSLLKSHLKDLPQEE